MFATYLRRELMGRKRQTLIIAIGMALAIALVIVVNAVASGVQSAQASVLQSVYGVGTDITVTQAAAPPTEGQGPGQQFDFGAADGTTADGTTSVSQSRLEASRGTTTFDASAIDTAAGVDGVSAAVGVLALNNTTFDGQLPGGGGFGGAPADGTATDGSDTADGTAPAGGPDGAGGSAFNLDSFSVLGYDPAADALGPLTAVTLSDGRALTADDAGTDNAILDSDYATSSELSVGDTLEIAGTTFTVVGIVTSTSTDGTSASNVYIPLDVAQTLSGLDGQISSVYVQAASASSIDAIKADLQSALPDATVNTQADLASTVSGSLSSASSLVSNLGTWLSILVLVAAFLVAILFTISGVTRRTREFGTLKALGWSNRRIVGQVAGESLVQGGIGGALGVALGLLGIFIVNLIAPTIGASTATVQAAGPGGAGGRPGGFGGAVAAAATSDITLQLPFTFAIIGIAVGLAILGGLLAGAFGGWRAARLRPAAAFRSVN